MAFKKPTEYNDNMVIVRDRMMEIHVNSIAICDPIALEQPIAPGGVRIETETLPKIQESKCERDCCLS